MSVPAMDVPAPRVSPPPRPDELPTSSEAAYEHGRLGRSGSSPTRWRHAYGALSGAHLLLGAAAVSLPALLTRLSFRRAAPAPDVLYSELWRMLAGAFFAAAAAGFALFLSAREAPPLPAAARRLRAALLLWAAAATGLAAYHAFAPGGALGWRGAALGLAAFAPVLACALAHVALEVARGTWGSARRALLGGEAWGGWRPWGAAGGGRRSARCAGAGAGPRWSWRFWKGAPEAEEPDAADAAAAPLLPSQAEAAAAEAYCCAWDALLLGLGLAWSALGLLCLVLPRQTLDWTFGYHQGPAVELLWQLAAAAQLLLLPALAGALAERRNGRCLPRGGRRVLAVGLLTTSLFFLLELGAVFLNRAGAAKGLLPVHLVVWTAALVAALGGVLGHGAFAAVPEADDDGDGGSV